MKEDAFSILHDGIIRKIRGQCPGDLSLHIQCDYLRSRLPDPGDRFILKLEKCSVFFYEPGESQAGRSYDVDHIGEHQLEILSSELKEGQVLVYTGTGVLHIVCETIAIWLNDKTQVSETELEDLAETYWEEWTKKAAKNPRPNIT